MISKNISFITLNLNKKMKLELNNMIGLELDLNHKMINKINKHINDKVDNLFKYNYFISNSMNTELCSHVITRGKNKNNICFKKITLKCDKNGEYHDIYINNKCNRILKKKIKK